MSRPDPIEYAERLYAAIRDANFSPISFLAFGNAVKDGVPMRSMPRIAVEPFMRIVGEMLSLEDESTEVLMAPADTSHLPHPEGANGSVPPIEVTASDSPNDRVLVSTDPARPRRRRS
jgi:hypothetical protein